VGCVVADVCARAAWGSAPDAALATSSITVSARSGGASQEAPRSL
jgi:hypothetical protein